MRWNWIGALAVAGLCITAARAQSAEEHLPPSMGLVHTEAQSTTRLPNTVADVTVGVEITGKDVDTVASLLSQQSNTLMHYLQGLGADRLATGQISFEPQNHTAKTGVESIVGYTGSTSVTFRTTSDKLGAALSGALANGANRVEQTNLHPRETEEEAARTNLAEQATRRALAEADAVARAAGAHVLSVRDVSVGGPATPVRPMMFAALAMRDKSAAPISISAGDSEVSVTVSVAVTITK